MVYVGDRPDVDGAGAAAAGMRAVIVGRSSTRPGTSPAVAMVGSLRELPLLLAGPEAGTDGNAWDRL
ncbi:MAG TPA: HAD hydrolase-like protein [Methylomirabilota bacterium]